MVQEIVWMQFDNKPILVVGDNSVRLGGYSIIAAIYDRKSSDGHILNGLCVNGCSIRVLVNDNKYKVLCPEQDVLLGSIDRAILHRAILLYESSQNEVESAD